MLSKEFVEKCVNRIDLLERRVVLDLDGFRISLKSNSEQLLNRLASYFSHCSSTGPSDIEVVCIQRDIVNTGLKFTDWKRERGKTGRKDVYHDLEDGRLIHKVRTGMLFLQSRDLKIAVGPCRENDNQVINFINAQYMNYLQQHDALICHAAAVEVSNNVIAFAGFSGGGKSTLMLHMLGRDAVSFVTNDRLFLTHDNATVRATGIPKLPRVNPGTLVNDPLLRNILSEDSIELLLSMPKEDLWNLEEKYDVDIDDVYGVGKISYSNELKIFVILNWHFNNETPCVIRKVDINSRLDLLPAVMKSPGPFYQNAEGGFLMQPELAMQEKYKDSLKDVTVFEITGKVDFHYAADFFMEEIQGQQQRDNHNA